jgi:hypothetical protein
MQVTKGSEFDAAPFEPATDRLATRDAIAKRKDEMLASPHLVELPFTESLAGGLYTRTLFIPKGCELVGKIHRKPCVNIVVKGDITIMTETGLLRVQAGYSVTSPAGIQKIGFAHEDTIFINVFRTDVTDIGQVEKDLICESFEALGAEEKLCLG